jgi:hypothetical protein
MDTENSLPYLQEPVTVSYPDSGKSTPHNYNIYLRFILILSFYLRLGFQNLMPIFRFLGSLNESV